MSAAVLVCGPATTLDHYSNLTVEKAHTAFYFTGNVLIWWIKEILGHWRPQKLMRAVR